jgi:hypothetical protein
MFNEPQLCELPQYEDLSAMLAVVAAIPDGMRLADFPTHCEGPECWCRPWVVVLLGEIIVHHKNLDKGEFDS